MSTKGKKKKGRNVSLIIGGTILIILLCIQLFFSFYLDDYVKGRLTDAVSVQTEGQYELTLNELNLSVWSRSMEIYKLQVQPVDTSSHLPKIDLEKLSINGIRFLPYLTNGTIQAEGVQLSQPHFSFVQNSIDSLRFMNSSGRNTHRSAGFPEIKVDEFEIEGAAIRYWKPHKNSARGEARNVSLQIKDVRIDSTTMSNSPYAEFGNLNVGADSFHYEFTNGLYSIHSNGLTLSTENRSASIDSLELTPEYPRYEFYRQVGHQIDRFDLTIGKLLFEGADIEKLKEGEFQFEKIGINHASLNVFRSKEIPRAHKQPKKIAPVKFKELSYPVAIDTIEIRETTVNYSEQLENVPEPGTVTFANLNGTFTGVTNDSTSIENGHTAYLDVTTELMNEATLQAHFEFPLNQNGRHRASGSLASLETEKLNPILEPVGLIRAENGTIHSLYFDMNLGPRESTGVVELKYSDLKIDVLDADNVDGDGRQFFKSLLANLLKIKEDNHEEPLRKGEVSFRRVQYKAIFNYWWKSLASGLKDNIGM